MMAAVRQRNRYPGQAAFEFGERRQGKVPALPAGFMGTAN